MKSEYPPFIELPYTKPAQAPEGEDNSDQYSESLPAYFIEHFSKKEAKIFDPFLGFGTTAFVAEKLQRIPYGMEADYERFEWAAGQLEHWQNVRHGDAADCADFGYPKMDLCVTSPPFMPSHHKWNPLYGGDPNSAGYECYLERMGHIFAAVANIMKRNALIVVQADNLHHKANYTPLVRDLSIVVSKSLKPVGETLIRWTDTEPEYAHTHCLLFKKL